MKNEVAIKTINIIYTLYERLKEQGSLYQENDSVPKNIISTYYKYIEPVDYGSIVEAFKKKYIFNETEIEEGQRCEKEGLGLMYDYIREYKDFEKFDIYRILILHKILYSKCPHPEFGGSTRTDQRYLPGSNIDIPEHDRIFEYLHKLDAELIEEIDGIAKEKFDIIKYINKCIKIKCKLIQIHPFADGNGRTARGFLNILFKYIGLPPVYIETSEKIMYQQAMNKAIVDGDYSQINTFYYYKICDSIYELDIKANKQLLINNDHKKGGK